MAEPKAILITAASGKIGSHLVPLLLNNNPPPKLILPTTNAAKLQSSLGAGQNAVVEEGTVQDPLWFQSLLAKHRVDTIFLCITGSDEMMVAVNCLDAAGRVDTVQKLVYVSIIGDFTSATGFPHTMRTRAYPHRFAKVVVEQRLVHGGYNFEWTVLGPGIFNENDNNYKVPLMHKSELPHFSEHGTGKIACSDIALAARNAMYDTTGAWNHKKVQLSTKKAYTGVELREIWSTALGKSLTMVPPDPEGSEELLRSVMPGVGAMGVARSLKILTAYLRDNGITIDDAAYEEQVRLLGKKPEDFEPWAEKTAAAWKAEAGQ